MNVRADLPGYCGKESYAYTPLRKSASGQYALKQVHVVIRYVPLYFRARNGVQPVLRTLLFRS